MKFCHRWDWKLTQDSEHCYKVFLKQCFHPARLVLRVAGGEAGGEGGGVAGHPGAVAGDRRQDSPPHPQVQQALCTAFSLVFDLSWVLDNSSLVS